MVVVVAALLLLFSIVSVCKPWHTCVRHDDRCLKYCFSEKCENCMPDELFCWLVSHLPRHNAMNERKKREKKSFCFDMWHRFTVIFLSLLLFLLNGIACKQKWRAKTCSGHQHSNVFLKIVSLWIWKVHFEIVSLREWHTDCAQYIERHILHRNAPECVSPLPLIFIQFYKVWASQLNPKCNRIKSISRWIRSFKSFHLSMKCVWHNLINWNGLFISFSVSISPISFVNTLRLLHSDWNQIRFDAAIHSRSHRVLSHSFL